VRSACRGDARARVSRGGAQPAHTADPCCAGAAAAAYSGLALVAITAELAEPCTRELGKHATLLKRMEQRQGSDKTGLQ